MFLIYDTTGEPTDIKTPTSAVLDEVLTSFARHRCVSLIKLEYCFPF